MLTNTTFLWQDRASQAIGIVLGAGWHPEEFMSAFRHAAEVMDAVSEVPALVVEFDSERRLPRTMISLFADALHLLADDAEQVPILVVTNGNSLARAFARVTLRLYPELHERIQVVQGRHDVAQLLGVPAMHPQRIPTDNTSRLASAS